MSPQPPLEVCVTIVTGCTGAEQGCINGSKGKDRRKITKEPFLKEAELNVGAHQKQKSDSPSGQSFAGTCTVAEGVSRSSVETKVGQKQRRLMITPLWTNQKWTKWSMNEINANGLHLNNFFFPLLKFDRVFLFNPFTQILAQHLFNHRVRSASKAMRG